MTWSERAACAGTPTEMWFPGRGTAAVGAYTTAQWYCDRCPVRRQCLQEALDVELAGARYGMRAGLTPAERSAIYDGDRPFPDFPTPQTIYRPEGAAVMTVTDITPQKQPEPPASVETLLAWGAAHQSSRIQALAGRARGALADLRQAVEREAKVAESEARIARLRAQLANAEQDLRAAKAPASKPQPTGDRPAREELAAIREWARENGYAVGVAGVIKREIVDAYRTAKAA